MSRNDYTTSTVDGAAGHAASHAELTLDHDDGPGTSWCLDCCRDPCECSTLECAASIDAAFDAE